ncbi:Membrane protein PxcA, involved in light-induced proton extrusion [Richelia intracellularis HH01]|uniref:Proton extrusion protein PxcA n=1 Tax=Richelia intracellularis HH01 TaxID=1165094 RepID=M1X5Z8_9NOST|nr:proton extrusion protein PcxA [Richelia intracellularis]CCH67726.1 Membrane protein PxcA, involved in light-induced proton extrusion [Richelia intracellularis HH01]HAE06529.1 proton extrusion protein PcxA [Richelia sp.]
MNNSWFSNKIYSLLQSVYDWYLTTPDRFLEIAYRAALEIKSIEDNHFYGNKIDFTVVSYSNSVMDYFQADLTKQLKIIRTQLKKFNTSRSLLWISTKNFVEQDVELNNKSNFIVDKLKFIDEITSKYTLIEIDTRQLVTRNLSKPLDTSKKVPRQLKNKKSQGQEWSKANTIGVLPRSIFNTINRLQLELDPNAEQDVVKKFRKSQQRTIISVRFILLLIIVPILTHQIVKAFLVGPILDKSKILENLQHTNEIGLFLNYEMEEEAIAELNQFEEKLKFQNLINDKNPLSKEQMDNKIKEKAQNIAQNYQRLSLNAIRNVFADILSVFTFVCLLIISQKDIAILKKFFDNIVYGLSDSAKAFIIILFTDIFVGFHSPHGWEVILEGISHHWGLPANHEFIFLFIATFPVVLDTVFKYWIFRYLNRISPSAVATYHNMNE